MGSSKQMQFGQKGFRAEKSDHGGSLRNPQKRKRPLGIQSTTHLVLRSSKAKNEWSFRRHKPMIQQELQKFSKKYYVEVLSYANVGNHIHLHLKIRQRNLYRAFIRALTASIMIRITQYSRWNKAPDDFKFWDCRPFSRIIATWSEFLNLKKYVSLNRWEGLGCDRFVARSLVASGVLAPPDP